jgi:hypothetical protein
LVSHGIVYTIIILVIVGARGKRVCKLHILLYFILFFCQEYILLYLLVIVFSFFKECLNIKLDPVENEDIFGLCCLLTFFSELKVNELNAQ